MNDAIRGLVHVGQILEVLVCTTSLTIVSNRILFQASFESGTTVACPQNPAPNILAPFITDAFLPPAILANGMRTNVLAEAGRLLHGRFFHVLFGSFLPPLVISNFVVRFFHG